MDNVMWESYDAGEFMTSTFPEGEVIVKNILRKGENVILVGPPKSAKTIFTMQLALAVASGKTLADYWPVPKARRVLYIALENTKHELQMRMKRTVAQMKIDPRELLGNLRIDKVPYLPVNVDRYYLTLDERLDAYRPELVIFDPFFRIVRGSFNNDDVMNTVTGRLNELSHKYKYATFIDHHTQKPPRNILGESMDELNAYFGSTAIGAWVAKLVSIRFKPSTHEGTLAAPYDRAAEFGTIKALTLEDSKDLLGFVAQRTPLSLHAQKMLDNLHRIEGKLGYHAIGGLLGIKHPTSVGRAAEELASEGYITLKSQGAGRPAEITRKDTDDE